MTQCECLAESTGERCSRNAKPNSKFCWQHFKKCTRTISPKTIPISTIQISTRSPSKVVSKRLEYQSERVPDITYSAEGLSELEQRYKEIREEAQRQLLGSGTYQEYREFAKSLEDEPINVPTFQEYEDMLDFAIQTFEDQYPQGDRNFDDMNPRERRQYLINIGESLGLLERF